MNHDSQKKVKSLVKHANVSTKMKGVERIISFFGRHPSWEQTEPIPSVLWKSYHPSW
jgi:hypothetical protein